MPTFALAIKQHAYGTLADRLGNGLQNRVEQFDSARYLTRRQNFYEFCLFFCFYTRNHEPQVLQTKKEAGNTIVNLYCSTISISCFLHLYMSYSNYPFSLIVSFSSISFVIESRSYAGHQSHSSRAQESSIRSGQLSAMLCFNGSTLYSISKSGLYFLIAWNTVSCLLYTSDAADD